MTHAALRHPSATTVGRVVLAACALACVVVLLMVPHTATAAGSRTCSTPKYPGVGYFTSLKVTGTGCSTGTKLVKAYYKCRVKHGKAGRCTSKVLGFACRETRNSIPTEIDARVTCRKGRATVVHTYQQDI